MSKHLKDMFNMLPKRILYSISDNWLGKAKEKK